MIQLIAYKHHWSLCNTTELIEVWQTPQGEFITKVDLKIVTGYEETKALAIIFSDTIDMDSWKHSWHMDCKKFKEKEVRDKIREIIISKQNNRKSELEFLINVERVLMAQIVYQEEEI